MSNKFNKINPHFSSTPYFISFLQNSLRVMRQKIIQAALNHSYLIMALLHEYSR